MYHRDLRSVPKRPWVSDPNAPDSQRCREEISSGLWDAILKDVERKYPTSIVNMLVQLYEAGLSLGEAHGHFKSGYSSKAKEVTAKAKIEIDSFLRFFEPLSGMGNIQFKNLCLVAKKLQNVAIIFNEDTEAEQLKIGFIILHQLKFTVLDRQVSGQHSQLVTALADVQTSFDRQLMKGREVARELVGNLDQLEEDNRKQAEKYEKELDEIELRSKRCEQNLLQNRSVLKEAEKLIPKPPLFRVKAVIRKGWEAITKFLRR